MFNDDNIFLPMITLHEIDKLEKCKGFLIGTTN